MRAYMFNTLYNGHSVFLFQLLAPSQPLTHRVPGVLAGCSEEWRQPPGFGPAWQVCGSLVPRLLQMRVHMAHCADHRADPETGPVCVRTSVHVYVGAHKCVPCSCMCLCV